MEADLNRKVPTWFQNEELPGHSSICRGMLYLSSQDNLPVTNTRQTQTIAGVSGKTVGGVTVLPIPGSLEGRLGSERNS